MGKTITRECTICGNKMGVIYDEVDENEAIERLDVYFKKHILNCKGGK